MSSRSRYCVVVDNLSSSTSTKDLDYEFSYAGKIRDLIRDTKARCCLIEYDRSSDAAYAYKKLHGMTLNGRTLRVEWATRSDFKFFDKKWFESSPSPSPVRGRKSNRSVSRSRSRSVSPAGADTPYNQEQKNNGSSSPRAY